jgi:hypothetical protein
VVFAIWHKTSFTRTKALVSIALVWLASVAHMSSYLMIPAKVSVALRSRDATFTAFVQQDDFLKIETSNGISINSFLL